MKRHLLILAILLPVCLNAQLKFNEIMSNNISAVMDDTYNYSMWVELYNASKISTINQSTYFITDDLSVPKKWKPTSKNIAPAAFNVLWFERDDRAGHSNFKLDPDGGKLYLLDVTLHIIDSAAYPKQFRNISYGRKTDNNAEWVFFEQFSPGTSNNNKIWSSIRCPKPSFILAGGFYSNAQNLEFDTPAQEDTIHFTIDGSEPKRTSTRYIPGSKVSMAKTSIIRAKTFSNEKLSSDIATATYFINIRDPHLPIVSIVTDVANLTDNTIGIYVVGTNGITGNGNNSPVNYNQPWDRPVNYELFDTAHVSRLNQELDIAVTGAYNRNNPLKSIKIEPRKKFGDSRLRYDFFGATKPNLRYRDIQMRNSGNDFYFSMMRDGFIQSLLMKRMDLDLLAYEPAVLFMNGTYYGIENLREESGSDYFYSNYGLEDTEVTLIETWDIPNNATYQQLSYYISNNDITKDVVYNRVCEMMDVDQFMNYMMSEIYIGNTDWPYNNVKIWKKKTGGKWRWLMYDTDFGFNLYDTNLHNHNTLLYTLGEKSDQMLSDWSNLLIRRLMLNETFRNKFVDRFCIQISSTFEKNRVNMVMDSLANKISKEIDFHKTRWNASSRSFVDDLNTMKVFSAQRPDIMMGFLSSRFANSAPIQSIHLTSNIAGVTYKMNSLPIIDSDITLKYFNGRKMEIESNPVFGYKFKQWDVLSSQNLELVKMGDTWKYFDGNDLPAANWSANNYSDVAWKSGPAQFGYGNKGEKTVISFGSDANAKYTTSYFRKSFTIDDLTHKNNFSLSMYVDDGAAIYINGKELSRYLLAPGALTFHTFTTVANNGDNVTYSVPVSLLKEGENLIAVEVHQTSLYTSDCIFDLKMTCNTSSTSGIITDPIYSKPLDSNLNLKAIYEKTTIEIPDDDTTVVLNEIVASNNVFVDEYGVKEDYIELFNTSDKDVNIAGWYLTDTKSNRTLSEIPTKDFEKTIVPARGRIILWADGQPLQGWTHLNFKLDKEGETIILSRTNSLGKIMTIDSVYFPPLDVDMSYSRTPDGGPVWCFQTPTFNSKNSDIVSIDQPNSSVDIYPTLVSESFTVQNASSMMLTITDLTGKAVYKKKLQSDYVVISAGYLQNGLYLVNVGNQRFKIIKR